MSEWLAAFEADLAADMAVTKGTEATEARSGNPFVAIVPIVPRVCEVSAVAASREWQDAFTRLEARTRPESITVERWAKAVADARYLVHEWGAALAKCGWTLGDLFSAHQEKPLARYDAMGLVLLVDGCKIGPIDIDRIAIRQRGGAVLHFGRQRPPHSEAVMLWKLPP